MTRLETIYNKWLKETKRSGGVLLGSSIREFFEYYEKNNIVTLKGEDISTELKRPPISPPKDIKESHFSGVLILAFCFFAILLYNLLT